MNDFFFVKKKYFVCDYGEKFLIEISLSVTFHRFNVVNEIIWSNGRIRHVATEGAISNRMKFEEATAFKLNV